MSAQYSYGNNVVLADGRRGRITFIDGGGSPGDTFIRFVEHSASLQTWTWINVADVVDPSVGDVTVTHVMAEADVLACFAGQGADSDSPSVRWISHFREPSVKWIVVAEPLVCESFRPMCNRIGSGFGKPDHRGCLDCNGTGVPDVQIVGDCGGQPHETGECTTVHGVVTIGAAVPIFDNPDTNDGEIIDTSEGLIWHWPADPEGNPTDITDEFGSQTVTPGMWAHPILTATP